MISRLDGIADPSRLGNEVVHRRWDSLHSRTRVIVIGNIRVAKGPGVRPRLIAISGPLHGQVVDLEHDETPIGREVGGRHRAGQIQLRDDLVSRQHCVIIRSADRFTLRDLDSYNQTYVNGLPVKEHVLCEGDQFQVGRSVFQFLTGEDVAPPTTPVYLAEDVPAEEDTRRMWTLGAADALYLRRGGLGISPGRRVHDLEVLLEISRSLGSHRKLEDLTNRLFDVLFDALPAERGAILLDPFGPETAKAFSSGFARLRQKDGSPFRVSRTVVQRVLRTGDGIVYPEVCHDAQLRDAESLRLLPTRSLICVPIREAGHISGILYVDSPVPEAFNAEDLQLLVGVAGMISAPLENLVRLGWFESETRRRETEEIDFNLIGDSEPMQRVRDLTARVAATGATVLIVGETGTGKELVARAIHNASPRSDGHFVDVNCASLKHELVESELFGSEPGGFTGAVRKKGRLEMADGGTLFLDEVGELDSRVQGSLLRVLESGQFQRIGGIATIQVDVRIVAATNMDLEKAIRKGSFREDLFHRLNVFRIEMPPLRERRSDIPRLAAYFSRKAEARYGKPVAGMSSGARNCILRYDWPGNVRQLQNAIEHAVINAETDTIGVEDLPTELIRGNTTGDSAIPRLYDAINEATKRILLDAVRIAKGKVAEAAGLLGIHPNNLHRLINRYGLKDDVEKIRRDIY